MPELPEVETTRRGISPGVIGKTVSWVDVHQDKLRWPVSPGLSQFLTGLVVRAVKRRAKYLLLVTDRGRLMIHLGMSGSLRIMLKMSDPGKHDHVDIGFTDGSVLRYRDPRRFGSMFWLQDRESHRLLADLGPEPLSDEFNGQYLYEKSRLRRTAVKIFLMNSRIVVGVGNIYANEALFRARIRPDRLAMRISGQRYQHLADMVKEVLTEAIAAGGTTLRDFVREDGSPGYFRTELAVYGRGGKACLRCQQPLKEIRLSGRSTVFCPECQRY